jgi:hypothetical protein
MMFQSAESANMRRGRLGGAGSAVKKEEVVEVGRQASVLKPVKSARGFIE